MPRITVESTKAWVVGDGPLLATESPPVAYSMGVKVLDTLLSMLQMFAYEVQDRPTGLTDTPVTFVDKLGNSFGGPNICFMITLERCWEPYRKSIQDELARGLSGWLNLQRLWNDRRPSYGVWLVFEDSTGFVIDNKGTPNYEW